MQKFKRKRELELLEDFSISGKSEFMYVRGRRRVGKSWLLKDFSGAKENRFMFTGSPDSTAAHSVNAFVNRWTEFSKDPGLFELKPAVLDWPRVFREINDYAVRQGKPLVIIFDEIQWICREGIGFAGALKEAWVAWQQENLVKVIICGSSNRFFTRMTGGEEQVLRGLQTRAHLWVRPLTPRQVKDHCFPQWNNEEACLVFMMTGGVPYYLERVDAVRGFIHGINEAFFTQSYHLLDEVDELLNLDFNKAGIKTVGRVLSVLGQDGCDHKNIALKTGIEKSTLTRVIEKLLDYEIVFEKFPARKSPLHNRDGIRYYMKDFFLNFFYQVLAPLSFKIRNNTSGLMFPLNVKLSRKGYHIPDFSGKAFELLVRTLFELRIGLGSPFFDKIMLNDDQYEIMDFWDEHSQIDLIIESANDRITRVLECKWGKPEMAWIGEVKAKKILPPEQYIRKDVLVLGAAPSREFLDQACERDVTVISLEDYFAAET